MFPDQHLTGRQKLRFIHCKHMNRCPTNCRQSDDNNIIELKVFAPDILAWMKEPQDITSFGVAACDIGTLVAVTVKATESQVIGL
jgi:hypothetical protein